jgi:hypothetical protein
MQKQRKGAAICNETTVCSVVRKKNHPKNIYKKIYVPLYSTVDPHTSTKGKRQRVCTLTTVFLYAPFSPI